VGKHEGDWKTYRTRFLIRARQLTVPLVFRDALGREHRGDVNDYLVESSDGTRRIAPRAIFEDIYVAMGPAGDARPLLGVRKRPQSKLKPKASPAAELPCELSERGALWKSPRPGRHPTC